MTYTARYIEDITFTVSFDAGDGVFVDESEAQRDVEIVIPDPAKSWYEDNPDVYWPKTGCDLRLYVNRK